MGHTWQNVDRVAQPLDEGDCHCWIWNISAKSDGGLSTRTLDERETEIARRFVFEEDRSSYVLCHRVLRLLLSSYLGCAPSEISMNLSEFGKPVLVGSGGWLHFSLSHTSSHALLAVARYPVGADIERVRLIEPEVAAMHFSEAEQLQLAAYRGSDWTAAFFRCWTRKEAILKGEGTGLNVPLKSFDVEIAHDREAMLLRHRQDAGFTRNWRLYDVSPSSEVIAALAVDPAIQKIELSAIEPALVD